MQTQNKMLAHALRREENVRLRPGSPRTAQVIRLMLSCVLVIVPASTFNCQCSLNTRMV